ncbi:hypothetical protein RND81_11G060500 [Saponaria officinalis]
MDVEKVVGEGEESGGSVEVRAGVEKVKSGKWVSRINYPDTSGRIWMGMFDTMEEAVVAYDKKKVEFEERFKGKGSGSGDKCRGGQARVRQRKRKLIASLGNTCNPEDVEMGVVNEETECKERFGGDVVESKLPRGVRANGYGKWEARIWHPRRKGRVSLGTFSTPEEAGRAVLRKQDHFEKLYGYKSRVQYELGDASVGECFKDGISLTELPHGVSKTESGRWFARIKHPKKKGTVKLGPYKTSEAAVRAFNQREAEFEKRFKGKERVNKDEFVDREVVLALDATDLSVEKEPLEEEVVNLDSNEATNGEMTKDGVLPGGITMTNSGRWGVRVIHPSNGSKQWVGSLVTTEAAVHTYNRRKADGHNKCNANKKARLYSEPIVAQKTTACYHSPTSVLDAENSDHNIVIDEHNDVLVDVPINLRYESVLASCDAMKSKDGVSDVPDFDEAVRMGIIDEYGQLQGEFSKFDEPMWCAPNDDWTARGYH